ncbi:hypothetical protein IE985_24920 [Klebsiella pneumoniae]|nr:hypothetical protein [Klebsiella pneumoniae]
MLPSVSLAFADSSGSFSADTSEFCLGDGINDVITHAGVPLRAFQNNKGNKWQEEYSYPH